MPCAREELGVPHLLLSIAYDYNTTPCRPGGGGCATSYLRNTRDSLNCPWWRVRDEQTHAGKQEETRSALRRRREKRFFFHGGESL
jgi:hypothetical protein